jgi:hypothetical protein
VDKYDQNPRGHKGVTMKKLTHLTIVFKEIDEYRVRYTVYATLDCDHLIGEMTGISIGPCGTDWTFKPINDELSRHMALRSSHIKELAQLMELDAAAVDLLKSKSISVRADNKIKAVTSLI